MSETLESPSVTRGAVVVGGVGEGLGFALSARFAAAGHPVLMLARSNERLSLFSRKIKETGGVAHWRTTDLRNEDQIIAVFNEAQATFGRIDEDQIIAVFNEAQATFGRIDATIYNAGAQYRKP